MIQRALHPQPRILIADDESSLRTVLSAMLRREGFQVTSAKDGVEALALLKASLSADIDDPFEAVIADIKMPEMDGMSMLEQMAKHHEDIPVIMLTAHGTVDLAVQALKNGAYDFLTKPYERDELLMVLRKALGQSSKNAMAPRTQLGLKNGQMIIGESAQMRQLHDVIERVADTPSTVLITGESGTGKELVAHALHHKSARAQKPFIRINCAAIPETLIESELFGYERGAFTGAVTSKPGRFELADGGTLFLDEIGELPVEVQVKLLRVLQESCFERVGGVKTIHMDVRLVTATNRDLQKAIAEGHFREDLYYRLNVVPIALPSLRDRKDDIGPLATHFVRKFNTRLGLHIEGFSEKAIPLLQCYPWPGNIRELENIVERTMLFANHATIMPEDLPPEILAHQKAQKLCKTLQLKEVSDETSMKEIVRQATFELERDLIVQALVEMNGNVTHAARKLKISRKSLQLKMKDFGLRGSETET